MRGGGRERQQAGCLNSGGDLCSRQVLNETYPFQGQTWMYTLHSFSNNA